MPIKPENKKLYPKNFKEISGKVKESQGHKCAFCNIPDKIVVYRGVHNGENVYMTENCNLFRADNSEFICNYPNFYASKKAIKVVLTTAHLNHDPTNNAPENLKALCQRCHNAYDAKHRAETRKNTKLLKNKQ